MSEEEKIIQHLKEKFNPKALILHGSRALGNNTPQSDWDIYTILDRSIEPHWYGVDLDGQQIDSLIYALPIQDEDMRYEFAETAWSTKILFDTDGVAQEILDRAQAQRDGGLNLSEKQLVNRKNYMRRTLNRLEDNIENDGVFFYRLGIFYQRALRHWYEVLHNEYSYPPYKALSDIESRDSEYFAHVALLHSGATNAEKLVAAQEIYRLLVSE